MLCAYRILSVSLVQNAPLWVPARCECKQCPDSQDVTYLWPLYAESIHFQPIEKHGKALIKSLQSTLDLMDSF